MKKKCRTKATVRIMWAATKTKFEFQIQTSAHRDGCIMIQFEKNTLKRAYGLRVTGRVSDYFRKNI